MVEKSVGSVKYSRFDKMVKLQYTGIGTHSFLSRFFIFHCILGTKKYFVEQHVVFSKNIPLNLYDSIYAHQPLILSPKLRIDG